MAAVVNAVINPRVPQYARNICSMEFVSDFETCWFVSLLTYYA